MSDEVRGQRGNQKSQYKYNKNTVNDASSCFEQTSNNSRQREFVKVSYSEYDKVCVFLFLQTLVGGDADDADAVSLEEIRPRPSCRYNLLRHDPSIFFRSSSTSRIAY